MGKEAFSNLSGLAKPITSCEKPILLKQNPKMGNGKEAFSNTLQSLAENFVKHLLLPYPFF